MLESFFDYSAIKEWIPFLVKGLGYTLIIGISAALFGVVIGILLTLLSKNKRLNYLSRTYIDVFRGTPVILQLSIIYFAIPEILDVTINGSFDLNIDFAIGKLTAAIITFSLNSGAYISEVIRSGINGVDKGEIEAAEALGVGKYHIYKDIIFPIAFKNTLPALMNEYITLVKESSIVSIIGVQDLMRRQAIVTAQTYMYFEPLLIVGIVYYVVVKVLTYLSRYLEKRLNNA